MNTIKFPARHLAKALVSTTAMMMILTSGSCHRDFLPLESSSALRVTKVAPAKLHAAARDEKDQSIVQACRSWALTKVQTESFFRLSKEYEDEPYSLFYQVPCSISGELQIDGQTWQFSVNGGATATWSRENATRHWGCSVAECEPLVIMATDFMDPD